MKIKKVAAAVLMSVTMLASVPSFAAEPACSQSTAVGITLGAILLGLVTGGVGAVVVGGVAGGAIGHNQGCR